MKRRTQKKILKARKHLLAAVVGILDEIDPMGLIYTASKAGFPLEEEYEPEAKVLVVNLNAQMETRDIENELQRIFNWYFRFPDVPEEYYIAAARKIVNAWLAFQGKPEIEFPGDIELPPHQEPIIVEID